MSRRILHILDATTPVDAVEALALLLTADRGDASITHEIAILGHHSTAALLQPPHSAPHMLPSMGWADPTGWRALRRLAKRLQPTHLHAWGIPAAVAASVAGTSADRIVTLAELPSSARSWWGGGGGILRFINRRSPSAPVAWVATSHWVGQALTNLGISPTQLSHIPPGIPLQPPLPASSSLREDLGLTPQVYPVLHMGGVGSTPASRHDYGLWVGAILQQIFPRVRVIVREDARSRQNHGFERFFNDLPDGEVPILAPADCSVEQLAPLADIFLVTAHANIASGSILHAMAADIPIVATAVESIREIIQNDRNGLLSTEIKPRPIAAPVEQLLSDPALRDRLTAAARTDIATHFTPAAMIESYHHLYANQNTPRSPRPSILTSPPRCSLTP